MSAPQDAPPAVPLVDRLEEAAEALDKVKYPAPYTLETTHGYYHAERFGFGAHFQTLEDAKRALDWWSGKGDECRIVDCYGVAINL